MTGYPHRIGRGRGLENPHALVRGYKAAASATAYSLRHAQTLTPVKCDTSQVEEWILRHGLAVDAEL